MAGERFGGQLDLFAARAVAVGEQPIAARAAPGSVEGRRQETAEAAPVTAPSLVSSEVPTVGLAASVAGVIEDAGEELTYNRRNRTKTAKSWGDIAHLNDALKAKEAVKANAWPKPDYQGMIDAGMAPMVAHIVKQVYDSVAIKPVVGRAVLDDAAMERYIGALNRVESGVMEWATDRDAIRRWASDNSKLAGAMMGKQVSLSDLVPSGKTLLDVVYPGGWKDYRAELLIGGGNKLLSALQPGHAEIKRAMKAIDGGWPQKREAWEVQGFRVVSDATVLVEPVSNIPGNENGSCFLSVNDRYIRSYDSMSEGRVAAAEIKPFILFGKRGFVSSFDSEEAAVEAAKDLSSRDKKRSIGEKGKRVEAVEREGAARRMEGEDITTQQLVDVFGLRGVNLGNWMKTPATRVEAQLHLNHAYDSLHDLAEILGVPPKAMSLNGMLGLAIGAQGSGGAFAAHFVPGVNEINLTRTSGAGSLGHEFAHALDHYFAAQAGLATTSEPFLTEHVGLGETKPVYEMVDGRQVVTRIPRFGQLRPEIVGAFKSIVDAMDNRFQTEDEARAGSGTYADKISKSLRGWLSSIRRDFAGQEEAFDVLSAKVMAGDVGEGKIAVGRSTYISPVVADMRQLYKSQHSRTYSLENTKALQSWIDSAQYQKSKEAADQAHVPQKISTDFAKNARNLDREKGGKPYWATKLEKFARAFDAFVSDELKLRSARNGYLSHTDRADETVPVGAEREAVNAAFRTLVAGLEVRETEKGAAMFSAASATGHAPMAVTAMQAEIGRIRRQWPSMPKVTLVQDVQDLPFEAPWNADGAYWNGEVFVVAGNVADLKQLQKVMAHECVMHFALEQMLGDYGFSKLHHGIQRLKAGGDPVIGALAQNIKERYGILPPDIETKEIVARAGEQCLDERGNVRVQYGFMKSVFAGVAGWLRDHGIDIPFSNAELQGILHDAGQWVKQERFPAIEPAQGPAETGGLALHSFAGVLAENAPLDALRVAREMRVSGIADRQIWDETGWTFGFADGKPRFEISDEGSAAIVEGRTMYEIWKEMVAADPSVSSVSDFARKYPEDPLAAEAANDRGIKVLYDTMATDDPLLAREVRQYFEHTALYGAYPDVAAIKAAKPTGIEGMINSGNASFVPAHNMIKYSKIAGPEQFRSTTLHELQHVVQEVEGFARGGNPGEFKPVDVTDIELARLNRDVHALYEGNRDFYRDVVVANQLQQAVTAKYGSVNGDIEDPLVKQWWGAIDQRETHPEANTWFSLRSEEHRVARDRIILSPMDQYSRLAGEVEARLTQARKDLSTSERSKAYPIDQMDVPVNEQVIKIEGQARRVAVDGSYSGKVVDVVAGVAIQKTGRGGETARHSLARLSEPVRIGDVVDITYKAGVGQVSTLALAQKER